MYQFKTLKTNIKDKYMEAIIATYKDDSYCFDIYVLANNRKGYFCWYTDKKNEFFVPKKAALEVIKNCDIIQNREFISGNAYKILNSLFETQIIQI